MTRIMTGITAAAVATTMAFAGGDIVPVEVMEVEVVNDKIGVYVGGGLTGLTAETTETYNEYGYGYEQTLLDEDFTQIFLGAGYNINEFVAVEGRYWFGVSKTVGYGDLEGYLASVDASVDSWGIYVKPQYPVNEAFKIYGLLGYASNEYDIDLKVADLTVSAGETLDGFSWGLGAAYAVTDSIDVFADYVNLYDDVNDYSDGYGIASVEDRIDTFNVGVNYKF